MHEGGAAQAYGLVKIRLEVVDNNGDGRMVGRHILHVLEDAAPNPSRFLLDEAVVGLLVMVDLPVEDICYPIDTKNSDIHGRSGLKSADNDGCSRSPA